MKAQFFASQPDVEQPLELSLALTRQMERSSDCSIRVSLHRLVNQLLADLQPQAMKRNNVILNGISQDLSIDTDENQLAYVLWNLINSAVISTRKECIHIVALERGDRMMICLKDVGSCFYRTISHEYRKVQDAAEKLGGSISINNDATYGSNISFSILHRRMAA